MDVYCPKCSEPWDSDTIHDEVSKRYPMKPWYVMSKPAAWHAPDETVMIDGNPHTYHVYKSHNTNPFFNPTQGAWYDEKIYAEHYEPVVAEFTRNGCEAFGVPHNDTKANPALSMVYEMMGDDLDGAAAFIEDMDLTREDA